MFSCISAIYWARQRTWFVMCGGRSSVLHYGPLIENRHLQYVRPDAEWDCPLSLNKRNTTLPQTVTHKDVPAKQ